MKSEIFKDAACDIVLEAQPADELRCRLKLVIAPEGFELAADGGNRVRSEVVCHALEAVCCVGKGVAVPSAETFGEVGEVAGCPFQERCDQPGNQIRRDDVAKLIESFRDRLFG